MSSLYEKFPEPQIKRISTKTIGASIMAVLNLERGILYTIWEMIKNPGEAMRRYLFTDRTGFIEPLKFLVLVIPIYLFLNFTFFSDVGMMADLQEGFVNGSKAGKEAKAQELIQGFLKQFEQYSNLVLLLTVPLAAIFSWLFFRKYRLNFAEHLVLNAYLYGFLTFTCTLLLPLSWYSGGGYSYAITFLYLVYTTYFLRSFFQFSWWRAVANSILIQLSNLVLFFLIAIIGIIITITITKG
jgi:hypothetical protein